MKKRIVLLLLLILLIAKISFALPNNFTKVSLLGKFAIKFLENINANNFNITNIDYICYSNGICVRGVSGNVSGSGIVGGIAYFTDINTISSDGNLYWDINNKRLGVGTSNPQMRIDLSGGGITVNGNDWSSSDLLPSLRWVETGRMDMGWGGGGGGNFELYSRGHYERAGQFKIIYGGGDFGAVYFTHFDGTSWNNKMVLTKNGFLGIGTDNPSYIVDVFNTVDWGGFRVKGSQSTQLILEAPYGYTSQYIFFQDNKPKFSTFLNWDGNFMTYGRFDDWGSYAGPVFGINRNYGNIGINTTNIIPNSALTVNGNILPSENITWDLGSPSNAWKSIYAKNIIVGDVREEYSYNKSFRYEIGDIVDVDIYGNAEVKLADKYSTKVVGVVVKLPYNITKYNFKTIPVEIETNITIGNKTVKKTKMENKTIIVEENVLVDKLTVALLGKVDKVKVRGNIKKGDILVSDGDGYATSFRLKQNPIDRREATNIQDIYNTYAYSGMKVGIALEDFNGERGYIKAIIGIG